MSLIGFRCPKTRREVTTGIDTERGQLTRMRKLKISVFCPDCPDGHGIPADEMFLAGAPEAQVFGAESAGGSAAS
jgi:hypothetical protein